MKLQYLFILIIMLLSASITPTPLVKAADATTTSASGMGYNFQRHTFSASTLCWLFYSDGTDMVYVTTDYTTQSAVTVIRTKVDSGNLFSVWHDGTYVHVARTNSTGELYYSRGLTDEFGVITWTDPEVEIPLLTTEAEAPSICVDDLGYPWIGFSNTVVVNGTTCTGAFITSSQYNNGTWGVSMPVMLDYNANQQPFGVCPTPTDDEQIVVFYAQVASPVKSHAFTCAERFNAFPTGNWTSSVLYRIDANQYILPLNRYSELELLLHAQTPTCPYDISFSDGTSMSGNLTFGDPYSPNYYKFDILRLVKENDAASNVTSTRTIVNIDINGTDPVDIWENYLSGTYYLDGLAPQTIGLGFVISNGGMEEPGYWLSKAEMIEARQDTEFHDGEWGLSMYSIGYLYQPVNVPSDLVTELSFYTKGNGSLADKFTITYSDGTCTEVSWVHNATDWMKTDFTANITAGKTIVELGFGTANNDNLYVDNVYLETTFTPSVAATNAYMSDGNYFYIVSELSPFTILKYTTDGFYYQGSWQNGTAIAVYGGVAYSDDFIFVAETLGDCKIIKINKSDMTTNATFSADVGLNLPEPTTIVVEGSYLYAGTYDNSFDYGYILKIDIPTFTYVANYTSAPAQFFPYDMVSDGTFLYAAGESVSGIVVKVDIATLSYVSNYTAPADSYYWCVTESGNYVYVGGGSLDEITKIQKSDMTMVEVYTLTTNPDYIADIVNDGVFLYATYGTTNSVLLKLDMSTMDATSLKYSEFGEGFANYLIVDLNRNTLITCFESNTYNYNSTYIAVLPLNYFITTESTSEPVEDFYSMSVTTKENNPFLSYSTSSKIEDYLRYASGCRAEITIDSGYLYIPTYNGTLYCLDQTTLNVVWRFTSYSNLDAGVCVDSGYVYFGDTEGYFYCLDALTGGGEWVIKKNYGTRCTPVVYNGGVTYIMTVGSLYNLDITDGSDIFDTGNGNGYASLILYGGELIFGNDSGGLRSIDATTGASNWSVNHVKTLTGYLTIVGDKVFYSTGYSSKKIVCVDADDGAKVWEYVMGGFGTSGVYASGGLVYSGCTDNKVYCVNQTDGTLEWSYTAGDDTEKPVISGGNVFFGCENNKLYCLDSSGSLLWNLTIDGNTEILTESGGSVYFGTDGNSVYITKDTAGSDIIVAEYDSFYHLYSWETIMYASTTADAVNNVLSVSSQEDITLFWNNDPNPGSVYAISYRNDTSAWDASITEIYTDATMKSDSGIIAFFESFSPTGVGWMTSNAPPYTIVVNPVLIGLEPSVVNGYLDDPDVGLGFINNVYSMYRYYRFIAIVSTPANPCDADTIYLTAQIGATMYFKVSATNLQGVPTYSIISNATIIDISAVDCTYNVNGVLGEVSFSIRTEWDFPDTSDLDVYVEGVNSSGSSGIILTQANNFDVVSSLVASISTGTIYVFLGQQVNIDGNVYYQFDPGNTTLFVGMLSPPDAQFTKVEVWNSTLQAQDWSIGNGTVPPTGEYQTIFMPDLTTGNQTYSIVLDMLPNYVDGPPANNPTITIYVTADWVPNLDLITALLQKVFDLFGMTGAVVALWAMLTSIGVYFVQSVTMIVSYVVGLGVMFFNFSVFFFDWVLRMSNFIRDVVAIVIAILGGTSATLTNGTTWVVGGWTGLGSVWTLLGGANLIMFMPFAIFIMWLQSLDSREKTMGVNFITIAINDFQTVYGLINVLTSFAMFIYSLAADWVRWIFGYLSGFFLTLMS